MFDTFGFYGVTIPILDAGLLYGTVVGGYAKSLVHLVTTSLFIFSSFVVDSFKPGKKWGEPQTSYIQGIFTISIITGLLFLYQTTIGYGGIPGNLGANLNMFLRYETLIFSPIFTHMIYDILDVFGIFTCITPIAGFGFDLTMGIKDILYWMIALDMTSYAMLMKPDVFKPCGLVISFGMIVLGIVGWILTSIEYYNYIDDN
jgi:hypothetical protein